MHEDLTSHDCIVLIITVYSHNIYQTQINSIKLQNGFNPISSSIHLSFILKTERERVYSILYGYSFISIFLFRSLSYYIIHMFIIIGTEGEVHCVRMNLLMYGTIGVLCTYYDQLLRLSFVTIIYGRLSSTAPSTFFSV